jgi:heptose-I-phosphate ethanolaminephosphotransferase
VISEIEFAARYTNAKKICITGSNGKTTTTLLIYHILKKAGYNVYFWDNQRDCNKTASYSFTLNSFLYNNEIVDMSYTMTNDNSYKFDEDIIKSFNERVKLTNEKNLILFHLMGQHSTYAERFPQSVALFTVDSVKRDDAFLNDEMKQCIADYDNATLYNDYVLSLILDTFKNSNTILFYFSDHGEEVYDYRAKCGRDHADLNDQLLKYQYDIPFVIWCSDIYKEKNPEIVDAIRQAVKRPFIIDNICNTLFNVGAINSAYYRDSLDIISPNYKCAKRKIKKNGKTFVYEDVRCK